MNTKFCIVVLLVALSCGLAKADTLNYTVTSEVGAGQSFYQFTLSNSGATGGTLFDLFVALPIDISDLNTATIGTPVGWGDPSGGVLFFGPDGIPSTSFVEWTADFSGIHDVPVGRSLSAFSFTALQPIHGPIRFALNDSTTLDTAVQGPAALEPATLPMLLFGGLAMALGGLWGRWRLYRRY